MQAGWRREPHADAWLVEADGLLVEDAALTRVRTVGSSPPHRTVDIVLADGRTVTYTPADDVRWRQVWATHADESLVLRHARDPDALVRAWWVRHGPDGVAPLLPEAEMRARLKDIRGGRGHGAS